MEALKNFRASRFLAGAVLALLLQIRATPAPTISQLSSPLPHPRTAHSTVQAQDGKVYALLGRRPATGSAVAEVDVYDPATGKWDTLPGDQVPPGRGRSGATATVLKNGKILLAGGVEESGQVTPTTLLFDPRSPEGAKWTTGPPMFLPRVRHGATMLKTGQVVVHGGAGCTLPGPCFQGAAEALDSAEIFDPELGVFLPPQGLPPGTGRFDHTGILVHPGHDLLAGDVRLFGGARGPLSGPHQVLESTLLYSGGQWCLAAPVYSIQKGMRSISPQLADGRIAILGGTADGITPVSQISLYDPSGFCGTETQTLLPPPPGYQPRWGATGTLLPNGKILVAGGVTGPGQTSGLLQVLRFDGGDLFLEESIPANPRAAHTAVLLTTGEVLLAGGENQDPAAPPPAPEVLATEKYDAAESHFCSLAPIGHPGPPSPLHCSSSALLPDGKVLVAFGEEGTGQPTRRGFVFDPAAGPPGTCADQPAGLWSPVDDRPASQGGAAADNRGVSRRRAPAVVLNDGKVLIAGGEGDPGGRALSSVRVFNPLDTTAGPFGTWRDAAALNHPRRDATATLLAGGQVLLAGGVDDSGQVLDVWEIYEPRTNTWTDCTHPAPVRRFEHTAALLPSGVVLIAGGRDENGVVQPTTLFFDPGSDPFEGQVSLGPPLHGARAGHSSVLLPSGEVLVAFGHSPAGPTRTSEVFDPRTATWTPTEPARESLQPRGKGHASVLLPSGKVFSVAGIGLPVPGAVEQEIYDPALRQWFPAATGEPLGTPWSDPAAVVVLLNGRTLVAGGQLGTGLFAAPGTEVARAADTTAFLRVRAPEVAGAYNPSSQRQWCFRLPLPAVVEGEQFGSFEAAGACGHQFSSALPPLMSLARVEGNVWSITPPSPHTWSDQRYDTLIPEGTLPGRYRLTIQSAGVAGDARVVLIAPPDSPLDPDGDFDGYGGLNDCDDADPLIWSPPGEVRDLRLQHAAGLTTLSWQAPQVLGAAAVVYDTLGATDPEDFLLSAFCVEADDGLDTEATVSGAPPPGTSSFFLVRAQNRCPAGEGPLGWRADGTPRPGLSCP